MKNAFLSSCFLDQSHPFPFFLLCLFVCVSFDGFLELRAWHDVFQMKAINRMLMPPHAGLDEDIDFE